MDMNEELVLRMEAATRDSKNALGKMKAEKRRQQAGDAIKGLGNIFPKGIKHPDKLVKNPGAILPFGKKVGSTLFPGFKGVNAVTPTVRATKYGLGTGAFVPGGKSNSQARGPVKYKLL